MSDHRESEEKEALKSERGMKLHFLWQLFIVLINIYLKK